MLLSLKDRTFLVTGGGSANTAGARRVLRMHPASPAEPVLAAWGIATDGKPVFVALSPGTGESTDAWADFLTDLRDRGLPCPLLVVSDGDRGLIAAIEQIFPQAPRQRCLIHRVRTVLAKIPTGCKQRSATATGPTLTPRTSTPNPARAWWSQSMPA